MGLPSFCALSRSGALTLSWVHPNLAQADARHTSCSPVDLAGDCPGIAPPHRSLRYGSYAGAVIIEHDETKAAPALLQPTLGRHAWNEIQIDERDVRVPLVRDRLEPSADGFVAGVVHHDHSRSQC